VVACVLLVASMAGGCGADDIKQDVKGDQASDKAQHDAPDEPAATVEEGDLKEGDVDATSLDLEELDDSGVTGTASITPASDGRVGIEIQLDDLADDTHGVEARIGSCADALDQDPGEGVLDDATSFTLADIEQGTMHDDAKLPDDLVSKGTYTLLVYDGPDVEGDIAACVDVKVD
jgi:hypothetical protein